MNLKKLLKVFTTKYQLKYIFSADSKRAHLKNSIVSDIVTKYSKVPNLLVIRTNEFSIISSFSLVNIRISKVRKKFDNNHEVGTI